MFRRTGFKKVPGVQSFFQLEPRPRQPRLDCPDWKIHDLRNLLIRQLLHHAKFQNLTEIDWQCVHGGPDGLLFFVEDHAFFRQRFRVRNRQFLSLVLVVGKCERNVLLPLLFAQKSMQTFCVSR